jgi:glycosyltransferase involved in cell wall biosynthesis
LIELLGVDPRRIHTIYLGAESEWGMVRSQERKLSREALGIPADRPLAVFIGSIGHDRRKGFDVLLEAWRRLCAEPSWDVNLLLAGRGSAEQECRQKVVKWKLEERVRVIGFSDRVRELLAASDLLVSPVRYEAYGLNVQEAISRGIPAIVSASAGIAEKYGPEDAPLLLPDPEDVSDLASRLVAWRSNMAEWKARFERLGDSMLSYGWPEMARRMIALVEQLDESDLS